MLLPFEDIYRDMKKIDVDKLNVTESRRNEIRKKYKRAQETLWQAETTLRYDDQLAARSCINDLYDMAEKYGILEKRNGKVLVGQPCH